MGGRSADTAGSDFTHPFEYDPATNTWTTKGATYADNQVNNMACGGAHRRGDSLHLLCRRLGGYAGDWLPTACSVTTLSQT